jgi:hypothetical protein
MIQYFLLIKHLITVKLTHLTFKQIKVGKMGRHQQKTPLPMTPVKMLPDANLFTC